MGPILRCFRRGRRRSACRRVVEEAAIWLGDEGMKTARSITDTPLKALPRSEVEQAKDDTLAEDAFGGDFEGHQIWAFQPFAA